MIGRSILPPLACTLGLLAPLHASKHRAVWFWGSSSSPNYGAANVVGNNTLENQTIAFFNSKKIRRVYGSYGNRPEADKEPGVIAAWNAKLQAEGIQSQFLMAENTWIFPANHTSFLGKVQARVIDFNNAPGRTTAEKFDALHLDIEPQALNTSGGITGWSDQTAAGKKDYLFKLRDTYAAVRQLFVNEGLPNFPIYADLPVWFDSSASIGWTGTAERDQWFDDIASSLTGISLMPFDRDSFSSIDSGVSWELANITGMTVRVGLEADVDTTWADVPEFHDMMEQLETAYGPSRAVDIQSYRSWREALAAQPIIAVAAELLPAVSLTGADIGFTGQTGWNYVIQFSTNLCEWRIADRMRAVSDSPMTCPVEFDHGPRGFWKVERFQDLQGE